MLLSVEPQLDMRLGKKKHLGEFIAQHIPGVGIRLGRVKAKGWMSVRAAITDGNSDRVTNTSTHSNPNPAFVAFAIDK
jgi:hypothetical protein